MYDCTSTSQKTKNAKTALDSMSKAVLQSLRQRRSAATSLYTKEALIGLFYFIWRGSAYFIDSLKPLLLTGVKILTGAKIIRFHLRTVLLRYSTRDSRRHARAGRTAQQGSRCLETPCRDPALSRYILARVCKNRMHRRSFERHAPFELSKTDRALPKPPCRDVAALMVD